MLTDRERWRSFRHFAALVGTLLGLYYAVIGLGALFVSTGQMADLVLILAIFFITLPGAIVGAFAPRIGGWAIIVAGVLAGTGMSRSEPEALPRVLVLYVGPSMLVGLGLVIAESRERDAGGLPGTGSE